MFDLIIFLISNNTTASYESFCPSYDNNTECIYRVDLCAGRRQMMHEGVGERHYR